MIDLVSYYYQHPLGRSQMQSPTVFRHEGNMLCGDDITVYLLITWDHLTDWSWDGNTSMVTSAAASFLYEMIVWISLDEILIRNDDWVVQQWFVVSSKRKRAAVIALLATQNAIHIYRQDGIIQMLDDLIVE